jgi:precorrin-6A/cobalt-precorrin-6A reductase
MWRGSDLMQKIMTLSPPLAVLILGGTTEAYELASALADRRDIRVISSLAGRTTNPRLPCGEVRIGGFGGADGLAAYLHEHRLEAVIDATHPFSAAMGWNAVAACQKAGVALLRIERPAWQPGAGDDWFAVDDWTEAADVLARRARRVLLAVGRRDLAPFSRLDDIWFLIRSVEAPVPMPPFRQAELMLARGPFTFAAEFDLLRSQRIDTILCKNSGGDATAAKLVAARTMGVRVVMRRRPPRPDLPTVATADEAAVWLRSVRTY